MIVVVLYCLVMLVSCRVWVSYTMCLFVFFFFKQKTAYEMRISDWSSDVCSSDLNARSIVVSSSLPSVIGKAGSESPTGVSGSNADATDEASNAETVRRVKRDLRIFKPHWKIKTIAVA